tara:strand:+ start:495 stop:869 length:375 start_codon:yes stop_codon:yes gene_type:complete
MEKELTTDKKREFIYENINNIFDTNNIINFVMQNDINFSKNKNGMHINISVLSEKLIDELYSLINLSLQNKFVEDNYYQNYKQIEEEIKTDPNIEKKKVIPKKVQYDQLELTDLQKEILSIELI